MKLKEHKVLIFVIVSFIELLILIFIDMVFYKGVISMQIVITLVLLQPFVYHNIIKKYGNLSKANKYKFAVLPTAIVILFIAGIPDYSYREAADLIIQDQNNTRVDFLTYPYAKQTVLVNSASNIMQLDQFYYFSAISDDQNIRHYIVDPADGRVIEVEEPYWDYKDSI